MDKARAGELLAKYLEDKCTPEERLLVESWYNTAVDEQEPLPGEPDLEHAWKAIYSNLPRPRKGLMRKLRPLRVAAAVILLALLSGIYFYTYRKDAAPAAAFGNDIAPGGDAAVLILADGSRIDLNGKKKGMLALQGKAGVIRLDSGELAYRSNNSFSASAQLVHNTLQTPRGGQYRIILPDGTKAWLNAASSITYPVAFSAGKRVVEITGEVYFEVAHDKNAPFYVRSEGQEVQVLGTRFNINAYGDGAWVRTTLLEGSLRVSDLRSRVSRLLVPGQQASLKEGGLSVRDLDTEGVVAWKNGYFMFEDDENIRSIMRKVARWYNLDIVYRGNMDEVNFTGIVSRFADVSVLLEKLELTGMVRFEIKGRSVTVISNEN